VPLVSGTGPPAELFQIDPNKVIGLTAGPYRLQHMRQARVQGMHMGEVKTYVDLAEIARELRHASALMQQHGWRCIDVSFKSVEEVAKEVLRWIGREEGTACAVRGETETSR